MIGVFDSGVGGLCALNELHRLMPGENLVYFADRKNAPYGNKSPEEIVEFCQNSIAFLSGLGARRVLIACCTASTMHDLIKKELSEISLPIISPTAHLTSESRRILVIATEHTAKMGAFKKEIAKFSPAIVIEKAVQRLVSLVECGCRDRHINEECKNILYEIKGDCERENIDTLILGCTHFSHLENELSKLLPDVKIINPAHIGARTMAKMLTEKYENGKIQYIESQVRV